MASTLEEEPMNTMPSRSIVVATLMLGAAAAVSAGGWSIITLQDFPDYARSGKPLTLTFSVRQHGNRLVSGLKPTVQASTARGPEIVVRATPTGTDGEYAATLTLPGPGDWQLRVDGGFNRGDTSRQHNSVVLPLLRVVDDSSPEGAAYSELDRGRRLMVTKGCVGCHAPGSERDITRKQFAADDLKRFLADPAIRTADMPNLELRDAEIAALIAFINGSGSTRRNRS
jgi:hypothetical protein